jgi:hypothetical protein
MCVRIVVLRKSCSLLLLVGWNISSMNIIPQIDQGKCQRIGRYLAMTEARVDSKEREKRNTLFAQVDANNPIVKSVLQYKKTTKEAIDFIARIPDIKFACLDEEINQLEALVACEVDFLAMHNPLVSFSLNKDCFSSLCSFLPESYEDHGGFFNSDNHRGVQKKKYNIDAFIGGPKIEEAKPVISREDMSSALLEMNIIKAFSVFRFVAQQGIDTKFRCNDVITDSSLMKALSSSYNHAKIYYFTPKDLEKMTQEQVELLRYIVEKSNQGIHRNIDKRFKITDEHVKTLLPLKDFILNNLLFKEAQIVTDIALISAFETIRDKLLFLVPRVLLIISPDAVYSQTNGKLQGAAGLLAIGTGSSVFGRYAYPFMDSYNSGVGKLSGWFGPQNHTRINKGLEFFWTATMHYICTVIAQKLWSWGTIPYKIVGGTVHSMRMLASLLIIKETEDYKNPFKRPSKEGVPFTLGDLVSGPKFQLQQSKT